MRAWVMVKVRKLDAIASRCSVAVLSISEGMFNFGVASILAMYNRCRLTRRRKATETDNGVMIVVNDSYGEEEVKQNRCLEGFADLNYGLCAVAQ